jgi:hypothetical protein
MLIIGENFVVADSEVLACSPSQRSSICPHVEPDVDHLFQLGVNVMYHEDMYLVV